MRDDQFAKIQELSEKLADVVIKDIDPAGWVGNGLAPNELTRDLRGDAYWCRKMAAASLSLLTRVANFTTIVLKQNEVGLPTGDSPTEGDDGLDKDIAEAEAEAARLMKRMTGGVTKEAFDKRVNGKS